jgi:hypothetical protein
VTPTRIDLNVTIGPRAGGCRGLNLVVLGVYRRHTIRAPRPAIRVEAALRTMAYNFHTRPAKHLAIGGTPLTA